VIRTIVVERWSLVERLLPRDLYFWLKAILLALIAVQLVRLAWLIMTPVGPFGDWKPAQARLLPAQTQSALIATVDPFFRGQTAAAHASAASTAGLQLFGVRQEGTSGNGSAIIGTPDGEQRSYVVGEEIVPGVKLAAVAFDYVTLDRGGGTERLAFPSEVDAEAPLPVAPTGAAAAAAGSGLTAAALRQAVSFAPRNQGTRITGIVVSPGRNPEIFHTTGFLPGDVVVAVNGARITSATDVQQLQNSLAPGARLALTVERGAQAVPLALNLTGDR
jgi:general secretion pathway protein C